MLSTKLKEEIRTAFNNVKSNMPNFKIRSSQNKMIAEIAKTLTGEYSEANHIICIEAPTGVGKTIAYLLSIIPIIKQQKKTLIISSANIALQEQLLNKDIPDIKKYSKLDFSFALAKGRNRYLCIRNLFNLTEANIKNDLFDNNSLWDAPPHEKQIQTLEELKKNYANKKWDGDFDNLKDILDLNIKQKIQCNRFSCNNKKCFYYQDCAFFKKRREIANVDVIIANHNLVLSDLVSGNNILPKVDESVYVFDEAHHLADKALNYFSNSNSLDNIENSINSTNSLLKKIIKLTNLKKTYDKLDNITFKIIDKKNELLDLVVKFDFDVEDNFIFKNGIITQDIKHICNELVLEISKLQKTFDFLKDEFEKYCNNKKLDTLVADALNNNLGLIEENLLSTLELFINFAAKDDRNIAPKCRWIKITAKDNTKDYQLNVANIDISNNLKNMIWENCYGVVLTSATLTSLGNFNRFINKSGLSSDDKTQYLKLASPFDYKKNSFIIANIKSLPNQDAHTEDLANELISRIDVNQGTLVLFTSNRQMQDVADLVHTKLKCSLLVQGEYQKQIILAKHIKLIDSNKGSVIFGLDSFSEGVDLPLNYCSHVIIAKLRFNVPTTPIEKANYDYLKSINKNPFLETSLPDASLRLIQAVGRLIRSEKDTGKITIFDKRLIYKSYGAKLLNALPDFKIIKE